MKQNVKKMVVLQNTSRCSDLFVVLQITTESNNDIYELDTTFTICHEQIQLHGIVREMK